MVSLRGLPLEAARPRIIVPLFARSLDALRPLALAAAADPAAEVVELRLDPLPEADFAAALALVRGLTEKPLLVTVRTKAEGGELALSLANLYDYCVYRLYDASHKLSVSHIEEVEGILRNLQEGWEKMGQQHG